MSVFNFFKENSICGLFLLLNTYICIRYKYIFICMYILHMHVCAFEIVLGRTILSALPLAERAF